MAQIWYNDRQSDIFDIIMQKWLANIHMVGFPVHGHICDFAKTVGICPQSVLSNDCLYILHFETD